MLTESQVEAVRRAMRVFVEDDLSRGILPSSSRRCDACESFRPQVGFIQYEEYQVCNGCATNFELARMRGAATSIGPFLRTRRRKAA
jgi:hypothetical protein